MASQDVAPMSVEGVRKRERGEPIDVEEEEQEGDRGSASQKPLELGDLMSLMKKSMADNDANFREVKSGVTEAKAAAQESKVLAAKATTIAQETKTKLSALEARVLKLETSPPQVAGKAASGSGTERFRASDGPTRDWDQLGGEQGDLIVLGNFRPFASKEERKTEWEEATELLSPEMSDQIADVIYPSSLCSVILLKLKPKNTTRETRVAMLDWCKKFKANPIQFKAPDENTARSYYAAPSKPYEMRKRDAKTWGLFEGLKMIANEEQKGKLRMDMGSGRILMDRTPIAERRAGEEMPTPNMEAITTFFPGTTMDTITEKTAEAMAARTSARRSP